MVIGICLGLLSDERVELRKLHTGCAAESLLGAGISAAFSRSLRRGLA
jgi:hypothetical protein